MKSPVPSPPDQTAFEDSRLADLLNEYVSRLERGDHDAARQLVDEHPQLADLAECLDALHSLSPASDESEAESPEPDTAITEQPLDDGSVEPSNEFDLPRRFGKYELVEEIGRGGMGVVFKARQLDLERTVAVKMILTSRLASQDDVRRFYAEARAAGSLRHPHIVGIHEVGQIHGQHYFAMDYVEGRSLADVLAEGPLDPETAATWLAQIARAVDFLHSRRIVHRDLKPSNILIDETDRPYITDFGLAKVFQTDTSSRTRTGTIVGTPGYMAPEQATGRPDEVTPACDVYSLGAILYHMLTGHPPVEADNPLDALVDVLEGEPAPPRSHRADVPAELEWITMRCLEKDPRQRYPSAAALADDLERFLRGEAVEARPTGWWQRMRRWARREPTLASHLGGLLVATGIVQVRYQLAGHDLPYHLRVMSVLGVWAMVCLIFQRMLAREGVAGLVRLAWVTADSMLLTTVLAIADGPVGPLLIGYPLLVAASGLFFRVSLVLATTIVSLAGYLALIIARGEVHDYPHYWIIFAAVLCVMGFIVAHQVHRVRVLGHYFERRRLS